MIVGVSFIIALTLALVMNTDNYVLTYLKNIIFTALLKLLIYTVILLLRIVLRIYLHTRNSTSKPMQCHQFLYEFLRHAFCDVFI